MNLGTSLHFSQRKKKALELNHKQSNSASFICIIIRFRELSSSRDSEEETEHPNWIATVCDANMHAKRQEVKQLEKWKNPLELVSVKKRKEEISSAGRDNEKSIFAWEAKMFHVCSLTNLNIKESFYWDKKGKEGNVGQLWRWRMNEKNCWEVTWCLKTDISKDGSVSFIIMMETDTFHLVMTL